MFIKTKYDNKYIKVDVMSKECKHYKCFSPHRYIHKGRTIDGKNNDWQDNFYSCSMRNYHGCPEKPELNR